MRFAIFLFAAAALSLLSGCTNPQAQPVATAQSSSRPAPVEETDWTPFSSQSGRFSFLAPGVPTLTTSVSQSTALQTFSYHLYVRQGQYKSYYLFDYVDYSVEQMKKVDPRDFITKLTAPMLVEGQSTLVYQKPITLNGFPGMEWQNKAGRDLSYVTTNQTYIANNRLYQISTIMKKEKFDQGDTTKFLNSIQLFK